MPLTDKEITARAREHWKYRAVLASRGQLTQLGCILLAVLNRPAAKPPWFGPSCVIDWGGRVLANFVDKNNVMHPAMWVCSVRDLSGNFAGLMDAINANDEEREELRVLLVKWIAKDYRAIKRAGGLVN